MTALVVPYLVRLVAPGLVFSLLNRLPLGVPRLKGSVAGILLLLLSILRGGGPACTAACTLAGRNCSGNAILRDSTSSLAAISEEYGSAPFIRRAGTVSAAGRAGSAREHSPPSPRS